MDNIDLGFKPPEEEEQEDDFDFEDDDYNVKWLDSLDPGKTFTGEIEIGEAKEGDYGFRAFLKVHDHKNKERLIVQLNLNMDEDDVGDLIIVANKKSGLYEVVDSLYHLLKETPRNKLRKYVMYDDEFHVFQDAINEKLDTATVKCIEKAFTDKETKEKKFYKVAEIVKVTPKE